MINTTTEQQRPEHNSDKGAFERFSVQLRVFAPTLSAWFAEIKSHNETVGRTIKDQIASLDIPTDGTFGEIMQSLIPKLRESFMKENGWGAGSATIGGLFNVNLFASASEYGCRVVWSNFTQQDGSKVVGHGLTIFFGNLISAKQCKDGPLETMCLQSIDGAAPYLSTAEVEKQLDSYTSRCVALAIPVDRGGVFNSIAGATGRDYNVLEIAGSSFQDKVAKVAEYLGKDREGRKRAVESGEFCFRAADLDLPGQHIPAERKALYQQMTGNTLGPCHEHIRDYLAKPQEACVWSAFQSQANPESNGAPAYLLIGQKEVRIAQFSQPSIWGEVPFAPQKTVYEMRGSYFPTNDGFLETVEGVDVSLSPDESTWVPAHFGHAS